MVVWPAVPPLLVIHIALFQSFSRFGSLPILTTLTYGIVCLKFCKCVWYCMPWYLICQHSTGSLVSLNSMIPFVWLICVVTFAPICPAPETVNDEDSVEFTWDEYLEITGTTAAPTHSFKHVSPLVWYDYSYCMNEKHLYTLTLRRDVNRNDQ